MFKNRQITVKLDKKNADVTPETEQSIKSFATKSQIIVNELEGLGKKLFIGMCIYVVLDTHRQVSIARANQK